MTRPIGPGPGAYGLPTTVGYPEHDVRKERRPQYSFGIRTPTQYGVAGPGPGAYKFDNIYRYGFDKGRMFSLSGRVPVKYTSESPGPGAHNIGKDPRGPRAPAFSIAGKSPVNYGASNAPGPNTYMFSVNPIKPGIPKYSMGMKAGVSTYAQSPGPAAYGTPDLSVNIRRAPAYTLAARLGVNYKRGGPGPDFYNLSSYKPGDRGQAYSFGVRHHAYAPPMIVECDN